MISFLRRHKVLAVLAAVLLALLLTWTFCLPGDLFKGRSCSTVVEARDGRLLGARISSDQQWRFPAADSIPAKFTSALILYEDKNFYSHHGIDVKAVGRALRQNSRNHRVVSGASTLSMQLIRLSRREDRTILEKVVEAFMATRLEARYSKEEILRLFCANAPFGGNVVGLEAASWRYFGRSPEDLSWGEAAMLAVLPNAPSMIHPGKNRERLLQKRNALLQRLCEKGYMSMEDCEMAMEEPLPEAPLPMPQHAPHLVQNLSVGKPGQRIRTDIDYDLQLRLEDLTEASGEKLRTNGINDLSAVVMDVHSGAIIAYVGNTGWELKRPGAKVDVARSGRSTGSTLKPFLYEACINDGTILPSMLIRDTPLNVNGFSPHNFDMKYSGAVPADEALSRSLNVPFVRMLRSYGSARFLTRLQELGMTTLGRSADDYGLSLILGGAEGKLTDLVSMYRNLALRSQEMGAWYTLEALSRVGRPDEMDISIVRSLRKVAWKTGTSFGFRDAWAIGVTPDYTVGVWAGNAQGGGVPGLVGARVATPIMFDIFNLLPSGNGWFVSPDFGKYDACELCHLSGHLAGPDCEQVDTLSLPATAQKTQACPYHKRVDGKVQFVLPPAMEYWYRPLHPEYKKVDKRSGLPIEFIYPEQGTMVTIPAQLDGSYKGITARIAHSDPDAVVYWHMDSRYLGSTTVLHQFQLNPDKGHHILSATDSDGNAVSVGFDVL